jgi:hypothetical protein
MSRKRSDWHIPEDWAFQFGLLGIIPTIAVLAGGLLPALDQLRKANIYNLYWSGLGLGICGGVLLFFARLPVYQQRRFWTFGPSALPSFHRKLYWLAYAVIVAALLLLGAVWPRLE